MEGGSLQVPVLEVELRRAGDELLGVKAKVCGGGESEEDPQEVTRHFSSCPFSASLPHALTRHPATRHPTLTLTLSPPWPDDRGPRLLPAHAYAPGGRMEERVRVAQAPSHTVQVRTGSTSMNMQYKQGQAAQL